MVISEREAADELIDLADSPELVAPISLTPAVDWERLRRQLAEGREMVLIRGAYVELDYVPDSRD